VPATLLESAAEVLVATGHDPFARGSLRRPLVRGWVGDGATAWMGTDSGDGTRYLSALGEPPAVAALLTELLPEVPARQRVTSPAGTPALLPAWVGLGQGATDWDFRWLTEPPAEQPGEQRVVGDVDAGAVQRLIDDASPHTTAQPGDAAVRRWWGVPGDDGSLLACAADASAATGVGHLASIAGAPAGAPTGARPGRHRGRDQDPARRGLRRRHPRHVRRQRSRAGALRRAGLPDAPVHQRPAGAARPLVALRTWAPRPAAGRRRRPPCAAAP
jgi:hypothetical protein